MGGNDGIVQLSIRPEMRPGVAAVTFPLCGVGCQPSFTPHRAPPKGPKLAEDDKRTKRMFQGAFLQSVGMDFSFVDPTQAIERVVM